MSLSQEIIACLESHETWLVLVHEKPDGDTLGCAAALASLGARLGKKVLWGGRDEFPSSYEFLATVPGYEVFPSVPIERLGPDGLVVCVDTSTVERSVAGVSEALKAHTVINIDHHPDNGQFGTINWIDQSASASGEMITELMRSSPWGITPFEAKALYTAIVSDCGWFRFPSATIQSHECAIELLRAGASPSEIARELESNLTAGGLHLWGRALTRVQTFADGRAAISWLKNKDFEETGCEYTATENLVNCLKSVKGVELVALMSEAGDSTRVSLRTHPPMSARIVAANFGGGGHDLAAGCKFPGSADTLLPLLRLEMERYIGNRLPGA